MSSPLAAPQARPLQVTYHELRAILLPLTIGYAWGENTIHDLWKMGAPLPNQPVETRIVFPRQLMTWLTDVLEKKGQPLDAAAQTLANLYSVSR